MVNMNTILLTSPVHYSHPLTCLSKQQSPAHLYTISQRQAAQSMHPVLKRDKKLTVAAATQTNVTVDSRPLANFHPCVWGDRFVLSDSDCSELIKRDAELSLKVEAFTNELKIELYETNEYPMKQLELIDTIQRLGIGYLFEEEIDQALQIIYNNNLEFYESNNDLYSVALSFRLLRQHGHRVSCEIFDKFKEETGEFKASFTSHVMGVLEFHEATYLSIRGEDVLDHGRVFTRTHLQSILPNISNSSVGEQVCNTLEYSNRRELPRIAARKYISIYEKRATRHENLLQLAKLEYNRVQILHKMELSECYRWWKGLDVKKNFWFARDRFVENYIWAWGPYFEPQYSLARKYLYKPMSFFTIIDDMYDAYGTFEELQAFNEAIQRWSFPCLDSLPEYLKVLYTAIREAFEEIEDGMVEIGAEYRASYGKEAFKLLVQAYFDEIKWREAKYDPGVEEYLNLSKKTANFATLTSLACIGMGDIATKESFDWLLVDPPVIEAANLVARITGDIVAHEFERERAHILSAVECYMKEYGVSKNETYDEFNSRIEDAWKDVNEGMLRPRPIPVAILDRILNYTRTIESIYRQGDWFTHVGPEMQNLIKQLFIDPVPE